MKIQRKPINSPDIPPKKTGSRLSFLWDFRPRAVSSVSWCYGYFTSIAIDQLFDLTKAKSTVFLIGTVVLLIVAASIAKWNHARHPLDVE